MKNFYAKYTLIASFYLAFAFLMPMFAQAASGTNLVTNGGFESPVVTNPDKWDIFPSGTAGLGWTVEWLPTDATTYNGANQPSPANLEIQQSGHLGFLPEEGQQWAELDTDWAGPGNPSMSYPASVDIYQDITTTPGDQYTLTFAFSPRPDAPAASENVLGVDWDSTHVDTISRANVSGTQNEWQTYTYTLTATNAVSRLKFSDLGTPDAVGTFLDDVVLVDSSSSTASTTATSTATSTSSGLGSSASGSGSSGVSSNASASDSAAPTGYSTGGGYGDGQGQVLGASVDPVSCVSNVTNALVNESMTFTATGGDGTFSFQAPDDFTITNVGTSTLTGYFTSKYATVINVLSGGFTSACTIALQQGAVLGDLTYPTMPTTGFDSNIWLTYFLAYLATIAVSEIVILGFKKVNRG